MKTDKFILFVLLVSIILVSKMVLAQNASSLKTHITRSWTKEFVNRATNPSPIAPPPTNFNHSPSYRNYPYDYYPSYRNNLDAYPPSYRNNLDESWNDYSPCMGLGGLLGGLLAGFDALKTKNKKEKKYPTPKNNHLPLSNNQAWEDNLLDYLEASKFNRSREVKIQLEYDVIVRSGPSYNYNIIKSLEKGKNIKINPDELCEGIYDWKKFKNEIAKSYYLIKSQKVTNWENPAKSSRYKLWLELIEPKGWINIIDFFNNFNNNQDDNKDNFDVITLKIKTYVRSGPSYKNNVKRILLKGEKIWFDKNNLTKAFEDLTIQNKKDELWLELVRPEGWIYFKDFMSNYNNNSSRRR